MKQHKCENCGAHDFLEEKGYLICQYCNSRFLGSIDDSPSKGSGIALDDDVKTLLRKCQDDPQQAYRYANLILDIDPSNKEAIKYLRKSK